MIRFGLKCLYIFGLISTLCGAPASNGVHRVSRQDFTSNGAPERAAAQYQRPFESQNGVYRVQRQDFINANDIPFQNSYQSPYVNRFSMYNSGLGNTNRSYSPFPKLFVPAIPPRPTNPYLAIGLPNYNRIVPASSFQAKTQAPQITVYDDDSVLPALPHPPRYDLSSISDRSKSSSFEEDFSSVVEQFDMTEDRKAICKGANCRKSNPNDDADAVKPIRRRRSIDSDPYLEIYGGKPNPYYRPTRRYHWSRYFDDYEYDSIRPPRVHLMNGLYRPYASGTTTPEPITTESEVSTEQTGTSTLGADSIDFEAGSPYSVIDEPTSTTTPPENDCNTESGDQEFTDEFSQRVARSEEPTTPTSKPNELEFEYNDNYAPLPTINFGSATPRDKLVVDYPTGDDVPEDHSSRTKESSTESDPNFQFQDVDFEFASIDWQLHREPVEPKTATDDSETQTEVTSEIYTTEEQTEFAWSDDLPEDHSIQAKESSTDLGLNIDGASINWYFHRGTIKPSIEPDDSENPTDSNSETQTTEQREYPTSNNYWSEHHSIHAGEPSSALDFDVYIVNFAPIESEILEQTTEPQTEPETTTETETTEQQPEYSTSNNYWPEDHSIHAEESSTDSDPSSDIDGIIDFTSIECEFFEETTEPVTEPETTPETKTESETPEQQTESSPNNEIHPYSLSTLIILCSSWPEKYDKKLTEVYNSKDQSWTSICSFLNLNDLLKDDIEFVTEATTTEAVDTGFFDESEIFGFGVKTIGEDFQNLLEVIETLQIGNGGGDIWPELPEIDYDNGDSAPPSPTADTSPEVITLDV